jgi:glycosyltransferase involved in cell wall biosynthesis
MNTALVSVLMAAYNSEKYIAEAIESVLSSTYTNFELIICDDRSTDNTANIAKSYQQKDQRVRVYINEKNVGDYPNRNIVASYAKGTYLKYLDHDDVIYAWGLEIMVKCMQAFPSAGFGLMSYGIEQQMPYPILVNQIAAYRHYFFNSALIAMGPTGAIFTKKAFDEVNGFSGKPFVGDTEIWLTLSQKFDLVRMPNDLVWYRVHSTQESKRENSDPLYSVRRFKIFESALENEFCPLPNHERLIGLRNHKNVAIRSSIFKLLLKFKISQFIKYFKHCNFTLTDFLFAFKKNKIPI